MQLILIRFCNVLLFCTFQKCRLVLILSLSPWAPSQNYWFRIVIRNQLGIHINVKVAPYLSSAKIAGSKGCEGRLQRCASSQVHPMHTCTKLRHTQLWPYIYIYPLSTCLEIMLSENSIRCTSTTAISTLPGSYLVPSDHTSITCFEITLSYKSLRRPHNATLWAFAMAILLNWISTNTHLSKDTRCPPRLKAAHQWRRHYYVATTSFTHAATQCVCQSRALCRHDLQPQHATKCKRPSTTSGPSPPWKELDTATLEESIRAALDWESRPRFLGSNLTNIWVF